MARIPVYTREVGAPSVRTANVQIDDSIARGIGNLGASIAQVAGRFEERQNQQQDFDDKIKFDQHRLETETAFQQAQQNMPANATGFHDQFLQSRAKPDEAFLQTISPRNRDRFAAQWGLDREQVGQSAATVEYKARGTYETEQLKTGLDRWMTRIAADPNAKTAALAELGSQVDSASSIPAAQKEAIKKSMETDLATAKFRSLYGADPEAARRALGLPSPAVAGSGGPAGAVAPNSGAAIDFFVKRGYTKEQAAGIVGNLVQESSLNPKARNRGDGSDGSDSIGIAQWNGKRAAALRSYAAANNKDWHDFATQLAFIDHELGSNESGAGAKLKAARTVDEATAAFIGYERPRGWSADNPRNGDGWHNRVRHATRASGGEVIDGAVGDAAGGTGDFQVGGDPEYASIPYAQRFALANQAETQQRENQAFYRAGLESQVQDASAALMTTGRYDGAMPSQQDFINAYGGQRGPQEYGAFQRVVETGQQIDAVKTMTPTEQRALLEAQKPVGAGPGFAAENEQYATLQKAVKVNQQQRQADPSAYVQAVFPRVKSAWEAASQGPAAFQTALAATSVAQSQLGIAPIDQRLLPNDVAKKAADTFKQPDLNQDQRIGAVASTVFATNDPAQQSAIFRQLVDAGLPDMTEGAVRAYARGDQAAGERLFQAAMINPKDLPGKIASSEGDISQVIQDEVMADGEVGDLFYGLSFGQSENLVTAERDGKLLTRAVQLRMASGDDLDAAVAGARKDLFGAVQVVDNSNAQALIPETADANGFTAGTEALLPQVEQALQAAYPEPDAKVTGTARALVNSSRENRIKDVVAQGAFRNAAGGFAFVDPFTGKAVAGADGKPLSFTIEQILDAGKASPNRKTGDPLADANNPNSKFNQSLTVVPAEATPSAPTTEPKAPEQPSVATSGVPSTAAPLSLQEQLSDAQRSAVSAAVRAISAGADPKAITERLRKAGVPKELWPE